MTFPLASARRLRADLAELPPDDADDGTRTRLLQAALALFAEYGYYGTSIRSLGDAAGLSSAALYTFFPSKEHVLAELVRLGHEEHLRRVRLGLLECGNEPEEQLVAMVRAHVMAHADYPMLALVADTELHALSADLAAPALALRAQAEQLVADVVMRGIERGVFAVADPVLAIMAIGGMGVRVAHWFCDGEGYTAEVVADTYAGYALRILGAPERVTG
jgi:AcrR family transcriptional regulator